MKVVRIKVVMAALMALLAIASNSSVLAAMLLKKLAAPVLGLGLNPLLSMLPGLNTIGQCPTYQRLNPFLKTDFDGAWFVYQQSFNLIEAGWTCKKMIYSDNSNSFSYYTKQYGVPLSYAGTYSLPNPALGAISVHLQSVHAMGVDSLGKVNQFVVAGVGTQYMIIRACTFHPAVPGLLGFNIEYVYVLTRAAVPSPTVTTLIATALNTVGINSALLRLIPQTGC